MKKRKGIIIILVVVVACVLLLFFCDKTEKQIKKEVLLSDSEVEEYTALAYDLSKVNFENVSKVLIRGQEQKISFVFPENGKHQVTVNYSDDNYKISSNNVTYEQIESSVMISNRLISLKFDDSYRIECDNARKLISIYSNKSNSTSRGIFIFDFSDEKDIQKSLHMTRDTANCIFYWENLFPILIIILSSFIVIVCVLRFFPKKNKSKK